MNPFAAFASGFACLAILWICWLGWQLLRQNGRMLLRLDELENRQNEIEFGEAEQPTGLPVGSEAPEFELPDLNCQRHTLNQYRGESALLIFFNPACGYCRELLPRLAVNGNSSGERSLVLVISTGDAETNRQLFSKYQLSCPVLLQKEMEVGSAYKANGTPSGYVISSEGKIASALAIGAEALLEIAIDSRNNRREKAQTSSAQSSSSNGHSEDQSLVTSAASNRFGNRSLARSRIKRDGLKAGTVAPEFRLPRLDGRGELALSDLRGQRVLLVLSSPG